MIIVQLLGGLGNQMFQYALGRYLVEKNKSYLKLDITGYSYDKLRKYELDVFNIKENFASVEEIKTIKYRKINFFQHILRKIKRKKEKKLSKYYIQENYFHFDPNILDLPDNIYLSGYWQSEKYFKELSEILKKEFTFKDSPQGKNIELLEQIKNKNSISLHIRRGDYVSDSQTKAVHCVNLEEYYKKAVKYFSENINNSHFYVFSDDPKWVKDNFIKDFDFTIIDCNPPDKGYEDLRLMSACKHNIIANSSFSWWGAWLNNNPEKIVIAPSKWFNVSERNTNDLISEGWIKL